MKNPLRLQQFKTWILKLEMYFHTSTNPQYSITRVLVTKIRVLAEWVIRRMLDIGIRRKALRSLRSMERSLTGRKALVIANGPSLNLISLERVAEFQNDLLDVFTVNFFPISKGTEDLVPNYLVLSDPQTMPNSLNARASELWKWISAHPEVAIICPSSWFKTVRRLEIESTEFIYFDDSSLISWSKNISPLRARSYLSLTAYKALAVATHFGYSEIDIIGFDNSQVKGLRVNENNRVIQGPNHFTQYSEDLDLTDRLSNGVSDYFYDFSCAFADLRNFSNVGTIWNLDPNSYVDAFPKKATSEFRVDE
jgi:hypothetical protein